MDRPPAGGPVRRVAGGRDRRDRGGVVDTSAPRARCVGERPRVRGRARAVPARRRGSRCAGSRDLGHARAVQRRAGGETAQGESREPEPNADADAPSRAQERRRGGRVGRWGSSSWRPGPPRRQTAGAPSLIRFAPGPGRCSLRSRFRRAPKTVLRGERSRCRSRRRSAVASRSINARKDRRGGRRSTRFTMASRRCGSHRWMPTSRSSRPTAGR